MTVSIQIYDNLASMRIMLDKMKDKALVKAARKSIKKTLPIMQNKAIDRVRTEIRLSRAAIKRKHMKLFKSLRARTLEKLVAGIQLSQTPISRIEFVRGSKKPRNQRGKPIRRRRPLKIEVKPGKVEKNRKQFIARVKAGTKERYHLFERGRDAKYNRKKRSQLPIKKKSEKSLFYYFDNALTAPVNRFSGIRLQRYFKIFMRREMRHIETQRNKRLAKKRA